MIGLLKQLKGQEGALLRDDEKVNSCTQWIRMPLICPVKVFAPVLLIFHHRHRWWFVVCKYAKLLSYNYCSRYIVLLPSVIVHSMLQFDVMTMLPYFESIRMEKGLNFDRVVIDDKDSIRFENMAKQVKVNEVFVSALLSTELGITCTWLW